MRALGATARLLLLSSCFHSDEPDHCTDADGDGWGEGSACAGPDCDDSDPAIHTGCPPAGCEGASDAEGCPCPPETAPVICYEGPEGTNGIGACAPGLRSCNAGTWTGCVDQMLPGEESCNGADDDCDGEIDEGVTGVCGDCDPECQR